MARYRCGNKTLLTPGVFLFLLILAGLALLLPGCGRKDPRSLNGYALEENPRDNHDVYPYLVRTESSTWYLAEEDIALLGEEAYFSGLREILEDMEPDFADARQALAGCLKEDVPSVDIYTDFRGKAGISETAGAYYNPISRFIKVFYGWDMAKEALLHEYVHYLTMTCAETPALEGFWAEGAAEYISKIVCRNRMLRSINMGFSDEEALFYKEHGAWDEEEDCIDPRLFYFGTARVIAEGALEGMEYFSVSDKMMTRTPQIQQRPGADTVSHIEAGCILAYLAETFTEEKVFASWDASPKEMEEIFGKSFDGIYADWAVWNTEKCEALGLQ